MSELLTIEGDESFCDFVKRVGREIKWPGIEKVKEERGIRRWKAGREALDACKRAWSKSRTFKARVCRLKLGEKIDAVEMITETGLIVKGNPRVVDPYEWLGMKSEEFRETFPELVQE